MFEILLSLLSGFFLFSVFSLPVRWHGFLDKAMMLMVMMIVFLIGRNLSRMPDALEVMSSMAFHSFLLSSLGILGSIFACLLFFIFLRRRL